tara:strand:- start:4114 stop:4590 length:477 start_codon:yes stop_codon:yes gene_type:complete
LTIYNINRKISVNDNINNVFHFFSDANNLEILTPPWLNFKILDIIPKTMGVGTQIRYRLKLHGIPIWWTSVITEWNPPYSFTDEQKKGPYKSWIHNHTFESIENGTIIKDNVNYSIPFGSFPGGSLIHTLFVKNDVRKIFDFRKEKMSELFFRIKTEE